jgi:hypothetical protein
LINKAFKVFYEPELGDSEDKDSLEAILFDILPKNIKLKSIAGQTKNDDFVEIQDDNIRPILIQNLHSECECRNVTHNFVEEKG